MRKVLMVVSMMLLVATGGLCQRSGHSTTDYFNVPTANVVSEGMMAVALQGAGDEIWGKNNNLGISADLGVTERLQLSLTSDLENFKQENILGGVKFVAGPADAISKGGQVALFLYNINDSKTMMPGAALTVDCPNLSWLSYSVSGWYVDSEWEGGVGVTATLTPNFNLQTEYSTSDKYVFGVGLSYKNIFGEIRYIDNTDEFYGTAGLKLNIW